MKQQKLSLVNLDNKEKQCEVIEPEIVEILVDIVYQSGFYKQHFTLPLQDVIEKFNINPPTTELLKGLMFIDETKSIVYMKGRIV